MRRTNAPCALRATGLVEHASMNALRQTGFTASRHRSTLPTMP